MKAQELLQQEAEAPETVALESQQRIRRRFPIGAEPASGGGTHFRVWAPRSRAVSVLLSEQKDLSQAEEFRLEAEPDGYFSELVPAANPGMFYKFKLERGVFPDPASRFQPEGPHGPSQIVDGRLFRWSDQAWKGVERGCQVIYEMHIGTFTRAANWEAAIAELPELARLGITLLEVMPVAEFPGRFGWGYDGVSLFAPTRLYGQPDDFRNFINQAHRFGMGVILDVVYNHLGPDGNYLKEFSEDYFTQRHANEWGEAINFDGDNSGAVREFFITNAGYWIDEFHLDGLRLDATQQIFDASSEHVLSGIGRAVREAARGRATYVVAENEPGDVKLVKSADEGGYGLDALWCDDFHHAARVAATGRREAYYTDYRGKPQEFISAAKHGFLYQGQWFSWQKKRRGAPGLNLEPEHVVNFIQNHDQVANSLRGARLHELTSPGKYRALTALLLLGPGAPMLFQGQEFAASAPFLFFADHNAELAKLVRGGRKAFLCQFPTIAAQESQPYLDAPESEATFLRCKLDLSERQKHGEIYKLHNDLLKIRREDKVFSRATRQGLDGAVLGPDSFVLRFFGEQGDDRLLLINLGVDEMLVPAPEPLLAPSEAGPWSLKWSSESPCYGGCGTTPLNTEAEWLLPGQAAMVLAPGPTNEKSATTK